MRIGIGLPAAVPGLDSSVLARWAARAEARGFDAVGVVDRVVYDSHDPLLALAAAAAVTEEVELVADILITPLRPTALLAKQAATLDRLSRGRLTLGVGGRADDHAEEGEGTAGREARLEQQIHELRRLWAAGLVGPEPAQPGGPPLLVAGYQPLEIDLAARLGDGWTTGAGTQRRFARGLAELDDAWVRHGRAGRPRTLAIGCFALGDGARPVADGELRRYRGWPGSEGSGAIEEGGALIDAGAVHAWLDACGAAGAEEVLLMPCAADLAQVDLLADTALGRPAAAPSAA